MWSSTDKMSDCESDVEQPARDLVEDSDGPTDEQWKAVRKLLKTGLLEQAIPVNPKDKPPKAVWQTYVDNNNAGILCVDYSDKRIRDKFTRMLRGLRKKHKDGDLENEDKKIISLWGESVAKQFLKK